MMQAVGGREGVRRGEERATRGRDAEQQPKQQPKQRTFDEKSENGLMTRLIPQTLGQTLIEGHFVLFARRLILDLCHALEPVREGLLAVHLAASRGKALA